MACGVRWCSRVLAKLRQTLLRPAWIGRSVRLGLVLFFLWLTALHWHPYFGFTRFLQCDTLVESSMLPSLRGTPLYVYRDPSSYDGFYYAQIATSPALRDPALATAVDDLGYRARRILLGAVAWTIGLGEPVATVHAYAWLNIVAWFALAVLLWRLFPTDAWRGTVAWAGIMFATGTLLSVRLALTDLTALLFIAAAVMQIEKGKPGWRAGGWLGLAGLARETSLLGIVALWPKRGATTHQRSVAIVFGLIAIVPLALWLAYVWTTVGSSGAGLGNFAWPLQGWFKKTTNLLAAWRTERDRVLVISSGLGLVALTVQLLFFARIGFSFRKHIPTRIRRRDDLRVVRARNGPHGGGPSASPKLAPINCSRNSSINDAWWRTGAAFSALMLCLGPAVWGDDLPGAAVRVLLPLGLAFNVLAVRQRAAWPWLVLGNLSIVGGVLALWSVPRDPHEVAAGRYSGGSYVVHSGETWFAAEVGRKQTWAWCPRDGTLTLDTWPYDNRPLRIALALRGFTPRDLEISAGDQKIWHGTVTEKVEWIELPAQSNRAGHFEFRVHSSTPPGHESERAGGRPLGFAVCGVRVE